MAIAQDVIVAESRDGRGDIPVSRLDRVRKQLTVVQKHQLDILFKDGGDKWYEDSEWRKRQKEGCSDRQWRTKTKHMQESAKLSKALTEERDTMLREHQEKMNLLD